jgi:hypothetical protein
MAIDNQYDGEVVDGATKFQKREIAVSTRSTDKSKAQLEAVYRDTHRQSYEEVQPTSQKPTWKQSTETRTDKSTKKSDRQVKSTPRDGHRSGLPKTITESMPLTDDYRLQDIFSRACRSTTQSSDNASALELGKYNHLRETYVLGVNE